MGNHQNISIREHVKTADPGLGDKLAHLWQISQELHDLQNRADGTQNGRVHVETVENNGWRLLQTPDLRENDHVLLMHRFTPYEMFLFSCVACCHDFDKALEKYSNSTLPRRFVHGEGSADFVEKNHTILGLKDVESQDIAAVIGIHDLPGKEFQEAAGDLPKELASHRGRVNHHRLAVLLKAADILHTDHSRVVELGVDMQNTTELQQSKYLARSHIRGWVVDGHRIVVQHMQPRTPGELKAMKSCKDYMTRVEWPAVTAGLEENGFPHKLEFVEISRRTTHVPSAGDSVPGETVMPKEKAEGDQANVKLKHPRYLGITAADSLIAISVTRSFEYPMCLYEAATHGAAVAVAGLAVQAVLDEAKYLRDLLNSKAKDLRRESVFSPNKLKDHMIAMAQVKSFTKYMLFEQAAGPNRTFGVILNRAFCNLPDGHLILRERIGGVKKVFENRSALLGKLLREIDHEINKLPIGEREESRDDDTKWREEIRRALFACADKLLSLQDELDDIIAKIQAMSSSLTNDWNHDVVELWYETDTCRPRVSRELSRPQPE